MKHYVSGHGHCVLKVSFDFVKDIFGGAAEEDGACFGGFAFPEESEIFVANFFDLEESALSAYI